MNIAIVYGGKSSEHEVSIDSASSIVRTIDKKHKVHLIGIAKTGKWYLQEESERSRLLENPKAKLRIKKNEANKVFVLPGGGRKKALKCGDNFLACDVVFPILHGRFGEDGTIQGLFEMADIPFVGGGVMATAISMDKEKTKIIWDYCGLPVTPYFTVRRHEWDNQKKHNEILLSLEKKFDYPLFVKPARAGSSVGAGSAKNSEELHLQMKEAFLWDDKVLIETCIDAREIECSVTGNTDVKAYIPGEVIPGHEFYDYSAKYTDPNGAILKIPADLTDEQRKEIRETAIKAYEALDLSGLSRVDFFIDKKNSKLYLNEVNTIPGFTSISMFPKMCAASGLAYEQLIMHLLEIAIERFENDRNLKTEWA